MKLQVSDFMASSSRLDLSSLLNSLIENRAHPDAIAAVKSAINNWENFEPLDNGDLRDEMPEQESPQLRYDTLVNYAGYIWGLLNYASYIQETGEMTIEALTKEIKALNSYVQSVTELSAMDLAVVDKMPGYANAVELKRIREGYYLNNKLSWIGISHPLGWVHGRYIYYGWLLEAKLNQLKETLTTRQHALRCFYLSEAELMPRFGTTSTRTSEMSAYALNNGLNDLHFKNLYYAVVKTAKRQKGTHQNIDDLQTVLSVLDCWNEPLLSKMIETDISKAQNNLY